MSRSNIYKVSTMRRMMLFGLLFWCYAGNLMAQSSAPLYVIKMEDQNHYLSHTLQDAESFSPNCLWYSGPNVEYNYYFIDESGNYRYLSAPLQPNGTLSLTDYSPGTVVLNQPSSPQYFYDWDHGVARGERQSSLDDCQTLYNGLNEDGTQCWKVVWVSYEAYEGNMRWQMSSVYGYNPTTNSARYKKVTKTEHPVEILDEPAPTGGIPNIADFAMTYSASPLATQVVNGEATTGLSCTYRPAYTTYVFEGGTHNYYGDVDHGTVVPDNGTLTTDFPSSYSWTLTGEGAQYLSLSADDVANPTLTYHTQNTTTSHKMATLTLTATYEGGVKQVRTVTVTVKAGCQNPIQASAPVVTYDDVTLSWVPTAEKYSLQWKLSSEDWSAANEVTNITTNSYTFTGSDFTALGYGQAYDYRVSAYCGSSYLDYPEDASLIYHFTTFAEPGLFIFGSVYGGGRMANVNGNTEVVVIDCDSVKAVFGGNDIAGTVSGSSNIILGVNENDANATAYNNRNASTKVRVFDVYGGGNGYYAYNGTSFEAASSDYYQQIVAAGGVVKAMTQSSQVGEVVWENTGSSVTLEFPKIASAAITVTNDKVKVDSLFGGAKNAFITSMDGNGNGSTITFNGGTTYAVFGGNNIGGGQGYGKHHIDVVNTKTNLAATTGFGRSFGIGYLFGGGNKVYGSTTEITISGGQCDTVFAGGNSASVYRANVTVNCPMAAGSGSTFGSVYTNAITGYTAGTESTPPTLTMNDSYAWDGYSGVYNVRTLFGGNNRAKMEIVPSVTLTSGSVGTVYGGGNAGDMMAQNTDGAIAFNDAVNFDDYSFDYSTKVVMNSPTMLVDYLYGGCQMSNVGFSSWVQFQDGHVGTIYGGCNISGDVGSTRIHLDANPNNVDGLYQEVYGATYVEASGGFVHKNVFAGSNGFYHCLEDLGIFYEEGITYDPLGHSYVGMKVPTHNETHVVIRGTATVEQNVYAGGNMAPVGFTTTYVNHSPDAAYPQLVGLASVRMIGGEVKGNVYGGGCMASINGSNEVRVTGGSIGTGPNGGALYGGNDRLGKAGASGMSNRKMRDIYNTASDHHTPLVSDDENKKVDTYVGVSGNPQINTVYGGGNGAYKYTGPEADMQYCDATDLPIQSNIFVDIAIDGGDDGGYITNVYGGGNGVYAIGFIKVFLNVQDCTGDTRNHIGTIYGGNNMGDMDEVVPEIILLNGNVGTVYGGCNSGAMAATGGDTQSFTIGTTTYSNIGSYVRLLDDYEVTNTTLPEPITYHTTPTAKVTGAVYGGCRMNGVTNNSLVLVEGGTHPASMFGGSDISGTINGNSYVVVAGGQTGNIYGGGNGNYYYADDHHVYQIDNQSVLVASNDANDPAITAPICANSQVDVLGGQVGASGNGNSRDVFGGGYGHLTSTTGNVLVNINGATAEIYGDVYGGSALGSVNTYNNNNTTTVNILGGTLHGDIFGGGLGQKVGYNGSSNILATVNGKVYVNIGATNGAANPTYSGNATIEGNVYGCNNYNGSPQDDVYVNIYKTAHGEDAQHNLYPSEPNGGWNVTTLAANAALPQAYAINAVFGGGNLAAYQPQADKKSTVHVYSCVNTIKDVFGGGNAADVGIEPEGDNDGQRTDTYVIIEGGRIHRVIGGGNGEDTNKPAANIFGTANTTVYAGLIDEVYGGANVQGSVDAINLTMSNPNNSSLSSCTDQVYGKVFGCANAADYNRSVTTNILCGVGEIGELYGGSNLANIGTAGQYNADVTLNLYGGVHTQVFAGSKGDLASLATTEDPGHEDKASNIYGNVTLNLFGGRVTDAYGGSNYNGNIEGKITVNVLDIEDDDCTAESLKLTNVYGASNLADYKPTFTPSSGTEKVSPVVNIIHIKDDDGISGNVFGGGNQASVEASPQVNIGYYDASMSSQIPQDYPIIEANRRAYVKGNVFGGGNEAGVKGNPVINMRDKGTVVTGIYGGCNTQGNVDGDINVNIYGGTLGTSSASMTDGIFGGGKGHSTETTGNVTVTIGDGTTPTVYADIYGGSAFGEVGAAGKLAKVDLKNGTVYGTIFGGGKGDGSYAATVSGGTEVAMEGGLVRGTVISGSGANAVTGAVFGGCNVNGIVLGNATVSYTGGTIGATDDHANTYGGGLGPNTKVKGDVDVTVNGSGVNVYGDVYGGSAKGKVNTENGTSQSGTSKTDVTLTAGTIHGDLYGGGHGPDGNEAADVYGPITVTVEGGTVTNAFGCNNNSGTPKNTVTVNVTNNCTVTNVFGGGNVADYIPTTSNTNYPAVNIKGGVVTDKVVGGGNAANIGSSTPSAISCNPVVTISGGTVCTALTDAGVYGGCNTSGTVYGNIIVNVTNADGNTVIGTQDALDYAEEHALTPVSIHGGGFGDGTSTYGNITVNYGAVAYDEHNEEIHTEFPKLYGDLYGGSALGSVNSASASPANTTTVNVMNGSFKYNREGSNQYGGNIYGGGRGQAGSENAAKGQINGVVHVNIGDGEKDSNNYTVNRTGKADLKGCNVFGCNNTNGSPQQDVYVDVYQTKHVTIDEVNYQQGNAWDNYAIRNVYGGGNKAHYTPTGIQKVHNTIHACDNTIENVYGGGNAADTYGTVVAVDGGRYKYIFGGGNGQSTPANIGDGGVNISVYGGQVGWYFSGCNLHGTIGGGNPIEQYGCTGSYCPCGDELDVENYYFGANEAVTVGGLSHIINCGDNMKFKNVYGGSRLAVVYGDIKLWVRGGEIENLFAGNEGSDEVQADVKKYPASNYDWDENPDGHPFEVKNYLEGYTDQYGNSVPGHNEYGQGGNIILVLEGGHLTNVYGGNDYRGNVEGDITIVVDSTQANPCELEIDYLYGGNKKSGYTPDSCLVNGHNQVCLTDRVSPQVYLKNGSVTYDVYGGSEGGDPDHPYGNGLVVSNPKVVIGDPNTSHKARVGRDVYGGGSAAKLTGSPTVVVQGKATVEGNVFGGGREGDVEGSTDVKIAPTSTVTPYETPIPPSHCLTVSVVGNGTVSVKYYQNGEEHDVISGDNVPEGSILHIEASPDSGYSFSLWETDFGNIEQPTHPSTRCLMGPRDTILKATFVTTTP